MPSPILDAPEKPTLKLRKPYFSLIENTLLLFNLLFLLIGIGFCWFYLARESWLFIINPPIFILLMAGSPLIYIIRWQKASKAYDNFNETELLQAFTKQSTPIFHPLYELLWTIVFVLSLLFAIVFVFWTDTAPVLAKLSVPLLIINSLLLGPVHYLFIKRIRKLAMRVLTAL